MSIKPTENSKPSSQAIYLPAACFVVLSAVVLMLWWQLRSKDRNLLETQTADAAGLTGQYLETFLKDRIDIVGHLASKWPDSFADRPEPFQSTATELLENLGGFRHLRWIDRDGIERVFIASKNGDGATAARPSNMPVLESIDPDKFAGGPSLSSIGKLHGGEDFGFSVYWPVADADGRSDGLIESAFRIRDLLRESLQDSIVSQNFCIELLDGDTLFFQHDESRSGATRNHLAAAPLRVLDRKWELRLFPSLAYESSISDWRDEALTITGLLLAGVIALLVGAVIRNQESTRQSENRLRTSEERFRKVFEEGPMGVLLIRDRLQIFAANQRACQMLGYSESEFKSMTIPDLWTPDEISSNLKIAAEVGANASSFSRDEIRLRTKSGETISSSLSSSVVRNEDGSIDHAIAMFEDITERKRSEAELRESEEKYRQIVENIEEAVFEIDLKGKLSFSTGPMQRLFGWTAEELRELDYLSYLDQGTAKEAADRIQQVFLTDKPDTGFIYATKTKSGEEKIVETSFSLMKDWDGKPVGIRGVLRDITARRREEEAKIERGILLDQIQDAVIATDLNGTIRSWNRGAQSIFGYEASEILGHNASELSLDESFPQFDERLRATLDKGEPFSRELKGTSKSGEEVWIRFRISPVLNPGGKATSIVCVATDISERVAAAEERERLEEQLRHVQKMEAIGTLAGGIAHDFNNLLAGILGHANVLKIESEPGSDIYEAASVIETAADRAAQLTRQLLGFARQGKLQIQPVELHLVVHEVIALLGRTVEKNIRITQKLKAIDPYVLGDPNQIQQAILNLAVNARDAMPDGGEITFRSENVTITEQDSARYPEAEPGTYAMLKIEDTGVGIPAVSHDQIFDPFFTTKSQDKGTGMGLAMVYGIVKNHAGLIRFDSEVGKGSTFEILLPVAAEMEIPQETPAKKNGDVKRGSGRILVVDDEDVVRRMAARMLSTLGYETHSVASGQEAVDYYGEHKSEIDLAIIDMMMPGMDGGECFRELRRINPDVRAILSSGYTRDGAAQKILDDGIQGFIQKPYHRQQLAEMIDSVLA